MVVLAQEEARALKHNYIGTEHLLLGLLREEQGLAARLLQSLGVTVEYARDRVIQIKGQGGEAVTGQIAFTPRASKVLELALREALSLGHNYIGTEHILLGVIREFEGVGARILLDFDADSDKVRGEVIRMLGGHARAQKEESFSPLTEEAWVSGIGLHRVVPVVQQLSDGTWVVSVEVWDHGLVIRWATSERPPESGWGPEQMNWRVSDDVGTAYSRWGGARSGHPKRGFYSEVEFEPTPPPEATSLRIRRVLTDDELSISLTD